MNDQSKKNESVTSRRGFLKSATVTGAVAAAPLIVPSSVFGANAPSNRIQMGVIGLGTRGMPDLRTFLRNEDVQVMAVCDVNRASDGYRDEVTVMGLEPGLEAANSHYAAQQKSGQFQGVDGYTDFREIIARDDIDAVAVVTPDHWHAVMTIMAAQAGKDIFCQKPLTLTIQDGKDMIDAVRKNDRILQTGSQWRSHAKVRFACELVRNGYIGELQTIRASIPENNKLGPGPGWQPMAVPAGFDYPMWLGPAPDVPYHQDRCLYKFRFCLDYSGGQITNFGAHLLDIAQMGNGTNLTGPVEVEGLEATWPAKGSLFTTAVTSKFRAKYANGVELICESAPPWFGIRFEGSEGWVEFTEQGLGSSPESLLSTQLGPSDERLPVTSPTQTVANPGRPYADHLRNFLDCVKSREEPVEPVEVGHRTASLCHLGNIALQRMKRLDWDPEAERFLNDDQANEMLGFPRREDWKA